MDELVGLSFVYYLEDVIMFNSTCKTEIVSLYNKAYLNNIFNYLSKLENEYPNFDKWFHHKVIPGIKVGLREILIAEINGEIAGLAIIKDEEEKKICTLRVSPEYRRMGIGSHLLDLSMEELHTNKPLITVSEIHIEEFKKLLFSKSFRTTEIHVDKYKKGVSEIVFNGHLQ